MADKDSRGVYRKFRIERTDGSDQPGGKHAGCSYFVLDLDHDKHAIAALRAYAKSCKRELPELAADLDRVLSKTPAGIGGPPATAGEAMALRLALADYHENKP